MSGRGPVFLVFLLTSLLMVPFTFSLTEPSIDSMSLQVFTDGVVQVEARIEVDPLQSRVNLTSQGKNVGDLAVTNQDDVLLESRAINGIITIDTLGSQLVDVAYTTNELTSKSGSTWVFQTTLPVDASLVFPSGTTILSMDPIPSSIGVIGERTTLTTPSGQVTVSYIIGVVGTRERAQALLKDAQATVNGISALGIIITDAKNVLTQAEIAYTAGDYTETEELAKQATTQAMEIKGFAEQAANAISQASNAIDVARSSGRTSSLDAAMESLDSANAVYSQGDYASAATAALEANRLAQESTSVSQWGYLPILAGAVIVIGGSLGIYMYNKQRAATSPKVSLEGDLAKVDIQRIFDENENLRLDEKEVLRYINDVQRSVFITELRDRFDLPKSSAWRMMRRLKEMGVIKTEEIGRETCISFSPRYTK